MGGSRSNNSQTTNTTTNNDSFNKTFESVSNLSDVGNVRLFDSGGEMPQLSTFLPFAVIGIVGTLAILMLRKGGS